ncbi:MAG: hypothetical protein ABJF11_07235 [Reichenbachiella sp.]|uniref:hypothetical protein n=1 Tax=Reichenbachiella sp. TaxID=2184521 RepID=UPI003267278F
MITKIKSRIGLLVALLFVAYACKTSTSVTDAVKPDNNLAAIVESIGEINETMVNNADTHTLYLHSDMQAGKAQSLSYVVIENKSGTIVHKDKHAAGYVKWYDDYRLEVLKSTEMLQPGEKLSSRVQLIDVRNQNKILKSELEAMEKK